MSVFAIAAATLPPRSVVRPEVLTLQSAQSYHTTLLQSARAVERAHNHTARAFRITPRSDGRLRRTDLGSASCNPVDFGAVLTGATDCKRAMVSAMRQLSGRTTVASTMASAIRDLGRRPPVPDLAGGDV